ncbi:MAG: hypothetical protein LBB40_00940, partial [Holophagales bacterium]|nr:hypothetical protein [Holophagales bacterium]
MMTGKHTHITLLALLLGALGGTGLSAQAPEWSMGGRLAFGATLAGKEPQYGTATIGASIWLEKRLSEVAGLFCEFNYQYFYTQQYEATQFGWGYRPNPDNPSGTAIAGVINPITSVDTRRDQLEGYGLIFGYRYYITPKFSIHGGIGGAVWISQQQAVGEIRIVETAFGTTSLWNEGLAYTPAKRNIQPVINAGVKYELTSNASIEGNLRY